MSASKTAGRMRAAPGDSSGLFRRHTPGVRPKCRTPPAYMGETTVIVEHHGACCKVGRIRPLTSAIRFDERWSGNRSIDATMPVTAGGYFQHRYRLCARRLHASWRMPSIDHQYSVKVRIQLLLALVLPTTTVGLIAAAPRAFFCGRQRPFFSFRR